VSSPALSSTRAQHPSYQSHLSELFAHESEETFARILTLYGFRWQYEPVEFPLAWNEQGQPTKGFRPDFFLPDHGFFIEITVLAQRLVTRKNQKIRRFRELYPEVGLLVIYQRDFRSILASHHLDLEQKAAA
jgi:hypothetical protein